MAYKDLREWITQVDDLSELKTIEGADSELEIGAIVGLLRREPTPRPALLFDKIKGYQPGYRILTGALDSIRRSCLTMNLEPRERLMELVAAWREKSRGFKSIPPRYVKDGPVMENFCQSKKIDLYQFPAPKWQELDGGRYLGTGSVTITQDPEEGWINLGTYRVMVHNENTLGFYISPGKHGRIHREKYFEAGKPCPVAISFGHDPLLFMAASLPLPHALSEYDYAGGIKGEPIEVIQGPVTGLPIPAAAEIVIEGEAIPGETREEGPFGEFTGYYVSGKRPEPFIRVKSLMYRNNPIICGSPPARPPSENSFFQGIMRSALIWDEMEAAGVPDIKGVWTYHSGFFKVVAIKQRYPGHAKQAAMVAAQCHAAAYMGRYLVVVDEDIDPTNLDDVLWALGTRSDPETSIEIIRRCWSSPLDPIIPKGKKGFNSQAIIDACRPYEWMDEFPASVMVSPEIAQKVLERWGSIFKR